MKASILHSINRTGLSNHTKNYSINNYPVNNYPINNYLVNNGLFSEVSFAKVLPATIALVTCMMSVSAFAELNIIEGGGQPVFKSSIEPKTTEPKTELKSQPKLNNSRPLNNSTNSLTNSSTHNFTSSLPKPSFKDVLKDALKLENFNLGSSKLNSSKLDPSRFSSSRLAYSQLGYSKPSSEINGNISTQSYSQSYNQLIDEDLLTVPFIPNKLSLLEAQQLLGQVSPKLAANKAAITASALQAEASEGLNRPALFLQARATHYDVNADIDLTGVKTGIDNKVNGLINKIPIPLPNLQLPPVSNALPDSYNVQRSDNKIGANVIGVWPVYTAGKTEAVTGILDARTVEAQADAMMESDKLYTTLVKRYFTAQLAIVAADLREDVLRTVKQTDFMARRLFEEGFISKVERLEAQVALADAKSEAVKARNNANLAMTALQSLLRAPEVVKPTTPLFVSSKPLVSLDNFQNIALANHPAFKKIDAKYQQAEQLRNFSDTGFKPTVSLYGLHEIDKDPNWLVGVSASWKLWGGVDKKIQIASGDEKMNQALLTKLDTRDNIKLLVEKNWQAVENARIRYLSLNTNVNLAKELVRLKKLGFTEGLNTALDVTTAETKYLKARTEQVAAANDYVQALASLMESCGTPFAFNEYMNNADIRLGRVQFVANN